MNSQKPVFFRCATVFVSMYPDLVFLGVLISSNSIVIRKESSQKLTSRHKQSPAMAFNGDCF